MLIELLFVFHTLKLISAGIGAALRSFHLERSQNLHRLFSMRVDVWCQTDVGLKRQSNQDTFLLDPDLGLYIVADGMGGHKGGEVASALASQTVKEIIHESYEKETGVDPRELLTRAYKKASQKVYEESQQKEELRGMGTTMVVALIRNDDIYIANVGDSRAYLKTNDGYWQLTEDHSLVNEQIRAGLITEEQARSHFAKNVITRSVGFESEVHPDIIQKKLKVGDIFIICSDGLSGLVSDQKIAEICSNNKPSEVVLNLIQQAKSNGGDDNVTVLLLSVNEGTN